MNIYMCVHARLGADKQSKRRRPFQKLAQTATEDRDLGQPPEIFVVRVRESCKGHSIAFEVFDTTVLFGVSDQSVGNYSGPSSAFTI